MSGKLTVFSGIIFSDLAIKDAATGKLSLINMFSVLNIVAFPFQSPLFFVTALFTGVSGPLAKVPFQIEVIASDGGMKLAEVNGEANIPSGVKEADINELISPIPPMFIPKAGAYDIIISSAGSELGRRPLFVQPLTDAQLLRI